MHRGSWPWSPGLPSPTAAKIRNPPEPHKKLVVIAYGPHNDIQYVPANSAALDFCLGANFPSL